MTNLQALQDVRLQDLIYQVEKLEKLRDLKKNVVWPAKGASKEEWQVHGKTKNHYRALDKEIDQARVLLTEHWLGLLAEEE